MDNKMKLEFLFLFVWLIVGLFLWIGPYNTGIYGFLILIGLATLMEQIIIRINNNEKKS